MSYRTINLCANDASFTGRVTAAAAQEGSSDPQSRTFWMRWPIAASSDIEAAYASAVAADNPDPGGDESVITDGMILAAVQAHWNDDPQTNP